MRLPFFIVALFLSVASLAHADPALTGYGRFRFGMSEADISAVAPDQHWQRKELGYGRVLLNTQLSALGGIQFSMNLELKSNHLSGITFFLPGPTSSASACSSAFDTVVEHVETNLRVLSSGPLPWEYNEIWSSKQTAGGSQIRTYRIEQFDQQWSFASWTGDGYVMAAAQFGPGENPPSQALTGPTRCYLLVLLRPHAIPPAIPPPTSEQLAAAQRIANPNWLERDSDEDMQMNFPEIAGTSSISGEVELDCLVVEGGAISCLVAREEPTGYWFGQAALNLSRYYRIADIVDGEPTLGKRVSLPISFLASAEPETPPPPFPREELEALAAQAPSAEELSNAQSMGRLAWISRPTADAFKRYFPAEAIQSGIEGLVRLDCLVRQDFHLRCAIASEEPAGHDFGLAALGIAQDFILPDEVDGVPSVGKRLILTLPFRLQ